MADEVQCWVRSNCEARSALERERAGMLLRFELNLHPLFELAILQQSHATRKGTCPRSRSPPGMAEGSKCICCQKEIFEEQDYTTLICHAAGQVTSHTTLAHDKCWEKFARTARRISGSDVPERLRR